MVWCYEEGLVLTSDNKKEAEKVYEETKRSRKDAFDYVILAKIEKQLYVEFNLSKGDLDNNETRICGSDFNWVESIY